MAAPHVAGAAALLFAARPSLTAAAAAEILVASARPVPSLAGATLAGGRLDVARALERVRLAPVAAAVSASAVTRSSAMVTGHVDSGGLETEVVVEYGRTGVFGQRTPPRSLAAGASGPVAFELSGLSAGMTYHVRLVATNAGGSSYGPPARLVTSPGAARPVATTGAAVVGRAGRVTLRATVAGGQGGGAYAFEFGTTRRYGRRTAWLPLPAAGRATPVRVSLGGLRPGTRLHYRVVVRAGARRVLGANRTLRIPSARLR
jgi:hypothetical protein